MKDNNKEVKISFWAAHATTVVSVALVLVLIGIIAMITISAASETRRLRERIELSAIMADSVSNARAADIMKNIAAIPQVKDCSLVTKEQALQEWKADTDEDLEAVFGVNIFSPEVNFNLRANSAVPDSIALVAAEVGKISGVEEVAVPDTAMLEKMNTNINTLSLILGCVAIVMLVISFVLINNTVHLAVYSRRFTIHTMQLVGATDGFIRRPFIVSNMLAGLVAGVIASGLMAAAFVAVRNAGLSSITSVISWQAFAAIACALVLVGALICAAAAAISTARYLHKDYGELFK